ARGALVLAAIALASAAAVDVAVSRGASDASRLATIEAEARVRWSAWPALMILLLVMAVLGVSAYAGRRAGLAVAAFALFPLVLVTVGMPAVVDFANTRSARPLAAALSSLGDGTEIA